MGKGELTRAAILEQATSLASRSGLEGVTIGKLADELGLSKSGLFAHFKSKEALQIQVLEYAAAEFVERVVKPALKAPRGVDRLTALFEQWLKWTRWQVAPGGCIFVAAATEMDDRPGLVRDRLVEMQREWLGAIARGVTLAIEEKQFTADVDPEQFAHEVYGVMLAYHHARRLLRDPKAEARARRTFESMIAGASVKPRLSRAKRSA